MKTEDSTTVLLALLFPIQRDLYSKSAVSFDRRSNLLVVRRMSRVREILIVLSASSWMSAVTLLIGFLPNQLSAVSPLIAMAQPARARPLLRSRSIGAGGAAKRRRLVKSRSRTIRQ